MSYDLHIFLPRAEFPARTWHEVLDSFRDDTCEVVVNGIEDCRIVVDQSVISIGADATSHPCGPGGTRWTARVSTTMGRSWRASFIQHAIPYHALTFLPGVTVHDCQYHIGRSIEASSWSTPERWLAYAEPRLWRLGPKEALIDRGLFHADGRIRF
jgi:hypothetical protein